MKRNNIDYRVLTLDDLVFNALQRFNRYQETRRVWYKDQDRFAIKDDHFVEEWDDQKKAQVIESLRHCIQTGGVVVGAYLDDHLVGFANVEGEFLGRKGEVLEMSYIHVSHEVRGQGIGRQIFQLCCQEARKLGAHKLYIGAHPAEETQSFYRSVGCIYATEIIQKIYQREPLDIQLEYCL